VPPTSAVLEGLPRPLRWCVVCAAVLGVIGGVAGFVIGWVANPATSWFAVLEIGLPSALVGAVLGLLLAALPQGRDG
jgi:hypothetical protein